MDLVLLKLLKAKLASEGIQTFIKNIHPPAAGEVTPIVAWPELWLVDNQQFAAAMRLVKRELIGLTHAGLPWQCPACGEKLEGQFTICWRCGASREE